MNTKGFTSILVLLIVIILSATIIGGSFYFKNNFVGKKFEQIKQTVTNIPTSNKVLVQLRKESRELGEKFVKPTRYVFYSNNNLMLGFLNGDKEVPVVLSNDDWGKVEWVMVSPDGRHISYIKLPDKLIDSFIKSPPYEYHGSSDFELYIADISNPAAIKRTKVYSGLADYLDPEFSVVWDLDSKGLSFQIENLNNGYSESGYEDRYQAFHYSVADSKTSDLGVNKVIVSRSAFSPDGHYYLNSEFKAERISDNVLLHVGKTFLVNADDSKAQPKLLLEYNTTDQKVVTTDGKEIYSSEGDSITQFITNNILVKVHADLINPDTSYNKHLELINIGNDKYALDNALFVNNNLDYGYLRMSVSPDGNYLVGIVKSLANKGDKYNGIFVFNINDETKKYIGMTDICIKNYNWIDDKQIFVVPDSSCYSGDDKLNKSYLLDIVTGEIKQNSNLQNKEVVKVF